MKIKKFISTLAIYYREPLFIIVDKKEIANPRTTLLEDYLNREGVQDCTDLFKSIVSSFIPTQTTPFPLLPHIREILKPDMDEAGAREAAARIVHSVSMYGRIGRPEAKAYIGPLGWQVVQMQGGWGSICGMLTIDNQGVLQAQWRELALAIIKRRRAGFKEGPSLPEAAARIAQQIEARGGSEQNRLS